MPAQSAARHFHAGKPPKSALPSSECSWTISLKSARYFRRNPNPPEPNPAQRPTSDFGICRVGRSYPPSSRRLIISQALPDFSDVPFPRLRWPSATGQLAPNRRFRENGVLCWGSSILPRDTLCFRRGDRVWTGIWRSDTAAGRRGRQLNENATGRLLPHQLPSFGHHLVAFPLRPFHSH